ncbi:hypothetical protein dhabil_258 [Escherichia phage dhabil]|nr:hypothetical protein dhabil_258 [Escherichia phage dhabil]
MKSAFRFNGQELVVENVIPASEEFDSAVGNELRRVFGEDKQFDLRPVENFSQPEQTENIFNGVVTGQFESEAPISITVFVKKQPLMTAAGFISFRK